MYLRELRSNRGHAVVELTYKDIIDISNMLFTFAEEGHIGDNQHYRSLCDQFAILHDLAKEGDLTDLKLTYGSLDTDEAKK